MPDLPMLVISGRKTDRGNKLLSFKNVILMLLPFQVLMLSEYLVLDKLNLTDSLWGIILPGVFSAFPVFIMYRFFREIPDSLIESACRFYETVRNFSEKTVHDKYRKGRKYSRKYDAPQAVCQVQFIQYQIFRQH